MFDQLLESRRRRERRIAIVVGSIAAHLAIVGAAAIATARTIDPPIPVPFDERPIWVPSPSPARDATPTGRTDVARTTTAPPDEIPQPSIEIDIDAPLPPVGTTLDLDGLLGDIARHDAGPVSPARGGGRGEPPGGVFTAAHVDGMVALRPGSPSPRYPAVLRAAGVEGRVAMRFVVDTLGRVEPGSATVLASTDPRFTAAVEEALPRLRFTAARHGGRTVRMLVEMPFQFVIEER